MIGHSLDAQVQIYAADEWYEFLKELEAELPTIFITSSVVIRNKEEVPTDSYSNEEMPGLAVFIDKAPGEKCERCWIYSETTGEHEDHPTLCQRCATVMSN
jgi:isoleucyl-tRNA synthetase